MIYLIKSPEARKLENGEYEFFFSLKIGYTDDESNDIRTNKRLSHYFVHHRTVELLAIIPNGTELQEKKLHYKFKDLRWDNSNEWYIYDQTIIDYIKSVTLEELDKLPVPEIRISKFYEIRKELRKILCYVYSNSDEVDEVIKNLVGILGDKINEETAIDYLMTQGVDFSKYYEVKDILESGKFCDDDIINQEVADFLRGYQTLTRQIDKLKMLCELDMPEEIMKLVLNQLSDSDRVKSYYVNLGPDRIKQLGYNVTKMNKELGIVVFSQENLDKKIYSEFKEGDKINLSDLKERLKEIYNELNYKSTPKANDIENYFQVKSFVSYEKKFDGMRRQIRGYELIKKLK